MIDRAGLEIRYTLMGIGGLNPSLSAKQTNGVPRKGSAIFAVRELEVLILGDGIEAGTGLVDVGQVAVTQDAGIGMDGLQLLQQCEQGLLLPLRAGVGWMAVTVVAALIADAQ